MIVKEDEPSAIITVLKSKEIKIAWLWHMVLKDEGSMVPTCHLAASCCAAGVSAGGVCTGWLLSADCSRRAAGTQNSNV